MSDKIINSKKYSGELEQFSNDKLRNLYYKT